MKKVMGVSPRDDFCGTSTGAATRILNLVRRLRSPSELRSRFRISLYIKPTLFPSRSSLFLSSTFSGKRKEREERHLMRRVPLDSGWHALETKFASGSRLLAWKSSRLWCNCTDVIAVTAIEQFDRLPYQICSEIRWNFQGRDQL